MSTANIKSLEGAIRHELKSLGYFNIEIKNEHEKSFNVIADGTLRNIFLKVVIHFASDHINGLSKEQITNIRDHAQTIAKEPWAAIMRVNESGELIDDIKWTNLSRHHLA